MVDLTVQLAPHSEGAARWLELNAAWERAKMLEEERDEALRRADASALMHHRTIDQRIALSRGITTIISKYAAIGGHGNVLIDLRRLHLDGRLEESS